VVAGIVELKVGNRPGWASDRFPVHPTDYADENLGRRKDPKNALSFGGNIRPVNPDEADIICPSIQTQAAECVGRERVGTSLPCLAPEGGDGRVLIECSQSEPLRLCTCEPQAFACILQVLSVLSSKSEGGSMKEVVQ
jgi:hypothetical protein